MTDLRPDVIAFDADDTLWHNERLFQDTHEEFRQLLARYHDPEWIQQRLYETEMRNLAHFGYGVKSFILSMVETAVELTEGRVAGGEVQRIVDLGRAMLEAPVALLEGVEDTLDTLARSHELMVITKGDLLDQESKLERSGLRNLFGVFEVVSRKDPRTYTRVLERHGVAPERFIMVGNSLRSDVFPVLEIGGFAVHIPYHVVWEHERTDEEPPDAARWVRIDRIAQLPDSLRHAAADADRKRTATPGAERPER
jgi:putative hydrolase of the HAD superfamily